ncbi:unnamed protein product [Meloidogyne enterolobii]|uniref:Uncharacterized protein n=1 Tax=Meloidogyne enterolobii TaxID=390850 RepID=A0ACB0XKQ2_MELEN
MGFGVRSNERYRGVEGGGVKDVYKRIWSDKKEYVVFWVGKGIKRDIRDFIYMF